jgi:hypothetical protein
MFGLLAWLGFNIAANAKETYDNAAMKSYTKKCDENGNIHYMDNKCREYINGERTYSTGYTDDRGRYHHQEIGVKSGKVLSDKVRNCDNLRVKYDDEAIERAKKNNHLTACIYHPQFKQNVAVELSTGKVIVALMEYTRDGVEHYRKFYAKPDAKEWQYDRAAKGDKGVEITKDEYDRMWTVPETYSCMCDIDMYKALCNGEVE